jgi:soluble lytic murein transglycosylase-like protein
MKLLRSVKKRIRKISAREWAAFALGMIIALGIVTGVKIVKNRQVPLAYQSQGVSISWLSPTVKHWREPINEMAKKYNIDANLIAILMTMESGGYPKAESAVGAQGLMQLTPQTAKDTANRYVKKPITHYDLFDPKTSIEFGTAYLAMLRDEFGTVKQGPDWNSTVELLAAGYNGGFGAANSLEQGKGVTNTEAVVYSRDAFNMWRERRAPKSPTYDRWKERGGTALLDLAQQAQ